MRQSFIHTKPNIVLLLSCPIIALIAWLRRSYAVDVQLYDTYYVLSISLIAEFLITIILITSLLYWLTRNRTGFPQLTAAHVLGTIGIALYMVGTTGYPPANAAGAQSPMSLQQYQSWQDLSTRFAVALVTFGAFQILLVANLIVKWIKG
jgi:heme/copper-type cytochrome/quinol oxidase subunit 1